MRKFIIFKKNDLAFLLAVVSSFFEKEKINKLSVCHVGKIRQKLCLRLYNNHIYIKFIEPYSSTKSTLKENVCSMNFIKPITHAYIDNVKH
jgi:hypothetical protein